MHLGLASLSLRFGCSGILLPPGFAMALGRTDSTSGLGSSGYTSDARHHGSAQASCASGVTPLHRLSVIALGSPEIGSVSISRPMDVVSHTSTLAPPFIDAAMGCRPHSALGLQHLATPPVIAPMDASTICASVESLPVCLPVPTSPISTPQPPPKPPPSLPPSLPLLLHY
ncbi:hypothetical protein M9458_043075, partial [Cirrhinus mrigala]